MHHSAFLFGFFSNNVGDGAVTQGAVTLVRRCGLRSPITIVAPMYTPSRKVWLETQARHADLHLHEKAVGLPRDEQTPAELLERTLSSPSARQRMVVEYGLAEVDRVFYTGGEHLFSLGESEHEWNLLARLLPLLAAKLEGRRLSFLPSTYGPFETEFSRSLISRAIAAADLISARDMRSARTIAQLGLPLPQTLLDPAFFLAPDDPARPFGKIDRKLVSIVMRLDGFGMRLGNEVSKRRIESLEAEGYGFSEGFTLYLDVGRALLRQGFDLRLFIQCQADDRPTRLLAEQLGADFPGRRILINKPATADAMVRDLATGAATVTSRFHAAIFSIMSGCPPIGIFFREHGHKTPGLFELFGLGQSCFDGHAASAEAIAAETAAAIRERDGRSSALQSTREALTVATLDAYRAALSQS